MKPSSRPIFVLAASGCVWSFIGCSELASEPPSTPASADASPDGVPDVSPDVAPDARAPCQGSDASGAWSTFSQNQHRTQRADGVLSDAPPSVLGEERVGTRLGAAESLLVKPGTSTPWLVVHRSAGKLVASTLEGTTLWSVPAGSDWALDVADDLDGDGEVDLVLTHGGGATIIAAKDGREASRIGGFGSAPVASWAGAVLVLVEARARAAAYGWDRGISAPRELWKQESGVGWPTKVLGHGTPSGSAFWPSDQGLQLVSLGTGLVTSKVILGSDPFGVGLMSARSSGDRWLTVAIDSSATYSPGASISVLRIESGSLVVAWTKAHTDSVPGAHDFATVHGGMADLDGDGTLELVYSEWTGSQGSYDTHVVDAATGVTRASLPGHRIQAVAGAGSQSLLVTVEAQRLGPAIGHDTLRFWRVSGAALAPVGAPMGAARVLTQTNRAGVASIGLEVPAVHAGGLLVATKGASGQGDGEVLLLDTNAAVVARYASPADTTATVLGGTSRVSSGRLVSEVMVFHEDGTVRVLDDSLVEAARFDAGSYSGRVSVAPQSSLGRTAFLTTANGDLRASRLLSRSPFVRTTPFRIASVLGERDALAYLGGPRVKQAVIRKVAEGASVVGLDDAGELLWEAKLAAGTTVRAPGSYVQDLSGDGHADVLLVTADTAGSPGLVLVDGADGDVLATASLADLMPGADSLGLGALEDVDRDGIAELVVPIHNLGVVALSLTPSRLGIPLWQNAEAKWNVGSIAIGPLVQRGEPDVLRHQVFGGGPTHRFSLRRGELSAQATTDYVWGEIVDSSPAWVTRDEGVFDIVETGATASTRGRVLRRDGRTLAPSWVRFVSGGAVHDVLPGDGVGAILTSPVAVATQSSPTTELVLFGADDGYLYAIQASSGLLAWSLPLGAPVRHVIVANVDDTPELEIVVSLANGSVLYLGQPGDGSPCGDAASVTLRGETTPAARR